MEASESRVSVYDTFGEDLYSTPDEDRYHGDRPSNIISPSVLGDLDGDGYEDIALSCAHYYVEGSGRSYYFKVLTRKSPDAVLEDITDKVHEVIARL